MKVKYRHVSEPDKVRVYDSDLSYERNSVQSMRGISKEDWAAEDLARFERDKRKGLVLEFEVIDDAEYQRLRAQATFEYYKNRLVKECGGDGRFRFNAIEFICSFPGIDPVEMAVALKKDGYGVVFDDSSISRGENLRKEKMVERAFVEAMKEDTVDELIAGATAAAKKANQGNETVEQDFVKE